MTSHLIYCAGPCATPEDRWQLDALERALKSCGYQSYLPFRDGLDRFYQNLAGNDEETRLKLSGAAFALNLFRLVEKCDAVVFSMNGRVPDTAGTIMSAVASMSGIPVVLCKQDYRSTFHGQDNAMITGLSRTFSTMPDPQSAAKAVAGEILFRKATNRSRQLPQVMQETIDLGRKLDAIPAGHQPLSSEDVPATLTRALALYDESVSSAINAFKKHAIGHPSSTAGTTRAKGMVYCSGPLFCPGEVKEMADIARSLESSGWKTYLPHRDGMEAFVMKHTDNYAANLLRPLVRFFHRLTFAVDVYYLLKCDGLVFNMNGRVPDEGGVAEIGMAFAAGKPVVLYRKAMPGAFYETVDAMVVAVGIPASPVASIDHISGQLEQVDPARYRMDDLTGKTLELLPSHMHSIARLGQKAVRMMKWLAFIKPESLF